MTRRRKLVFSLIAGVPLLLAGYMVSYPIMVRRCSTIGDGFVHCPGPGPPGTWELPVDSGEFCADRPAGSRLPIYRPLDKMIDAFPDSFGVGMLWLAEKVGVDNAFYTATNLRRQARDCNDYYSVP